MKQDEKHAGVALSFFDVRGEEGRTCPSVCAGLKPPTRVHRKTTYSKPNATIKRNMPTSATGSV